MHRIGILGAGSFGTTLALLLSQSGRDIALFCRSRESADQINLSRVNRDYFPGVALPANVTAFADIEEALGLTRTVYLAVPCKFLRSFVNEHSNAIAVWLQKAAELAQGQQNGSTAKAVICNCSKGLLLEPTQRSDEFLLDWLADHDAGSTGLVHLSGPNLAAEIVAGSPAAAVAAAPPEQQWAARRVQEELMGPQFRVYTGSDPVGVEVAGFYKNVLAIAAGALQGLGLGSNSHAALLTRGLAEMGRLVRFFGGAHSTMLGLAGAGDLIATCSSPLSRNFQVGQRRATGERTQQILNSMQQVAEGVQTSAALHAWSISPPAAPSDSEDAQSWPDLPIAEVVYRILFEGLEPREAIAELMRRPPREE